MHQIWMIKQLPQYYIHSKNIAFIITFWAEIIEQYRLSFQQRFINI